MAEMGREWFLIKFYNAQDKEDVWNRRPWFVQGLNFVLNPWVRGFCPYTTNIDTIYQWVRIYLLPLEFWSFDCLATILKPVGNLIKLDEFTLSQTKVHFTSVYVNISTKRPLPGSLWISLPGKSVEIHINYEGMNEVCPL
uniref:DUF4283 domain-containing protein n=1 Tax=Chenopodium quinoa TaxID=63459 RepID=A0A803MBG7_CHEQI